ncbi:MAG: hypothetical protein V4608_14910 [Bacteroidota bacterium]
MKTAEEYITKVYGNKTFARALDLNDSESIMDLMNDFASHYANAKLDEAAEKANCIDVAMTALPEYEVDKESILSLKDTIL